MPKIGTLSLSARRAWIEIDTSSMDDFEPSSLSARRAWIEICINVSILFTFPKSLSARRAWIEIQHK